MDFRKVERKTGGEQWEEIPFSALRKGDHFKLYDQPGDKIFEDGSQVYVAKGDPFPCEPTGNFGIEADNAS